MPQVTQHFANRGAYSAETVLGWQDYRAGRTYHSEYDTMNDVGQRNYERGRLWAANYKLAFGSIPIRPSHLMVKRAHKVAGSAVPGNTKKDFIAVIRQRKR